MQQGPAPCFFFARKCDSRVTGAYPRAFGTHLR